MDKWLEHFAQTALRRSGDTAHDLKTPLNVAVLNLELLRMRLRKLMKGSEDEKLNGYAASIELELRRMARIFDSYFLLSTPPKGSVQPEAADVGRLCAAAAEAAGFSVEPQDAIVQAHEARIRQAFQLFFEGAAKIVVSEDRTATARASAGRFTTTVTGRPAMADLELTKLFKFYYTDPLGQPDLSMAAARLIAETYGGELDATQESDKVTLRLSLPLGER